MPNKVKYGSEDIELIHSLYRDLHESETLTEFLLRFISKAGEAARSEYYGIMLFPGALSDQMHIISNNPAEYEKAYSDYLGNIDAMFSQMMDNPSKLHCYSRDYKDNDAVNTFHHEGYNIRPNGDFFYTALGYEHKIAGFIGQVKAPGADQIYSSKELNLHYHLLPILETGIASLRNKEKMRLLASQANTLEGSLMLFIYPDGAVEILNGSNQSLADELFGSIRGCIDASMHPRLSALLENLFHAARQGTLHVKDRWILNKKKYVVSATQGERTGALKNIALVRIEPEREIYNFNQFALLHFLSAREVDVLRLITEGCSNATIAAQLGIAEQTVKRHIYNIFEKTGCSSRAQLVFLLLREG